MNILKLSGLFIVFIIDLMLLFSLSLVFVVCSMVSISELNLWLLGILEKWIFVFLLLVFNKKLIVLCNLLFVLCFFMFNFLFIEVMLDRNVISFLCLLCLLVCMIKVMFFCIDFVYDFNVCKIFLVNMVILFYIWYVDFC